MSGMEIVDHRGQPGASGARNAGAARAHSPCSCTRALALLVFLDDDTEARTA